MHPPADNVDLDTWVPPLADHPVHAWHREKALAVIAANDATTALETATYLSVQADTVYERKRHELEAAFMDIKRDANNYVVESEARFVMDPELCDLRKKSAEVITKNAELKRICDARYLVVEHIDARIAALADADRAKAIAWNADWKWRVRHDDIYAMLRAENKEHLYYTLVWEHGYTMDEVRAWLTPMPSVEEMERMAATVATMNDHAHRAIDDIIRRMESATFVAAREYMDFDLKDLSAATIATIKQYIDRVAIDLTDA
jgi:hypothetical protein